MADHAPKLAKFAREILTYLWEGADIDGADLQDMALRHGLIRKTSFDPKKHEDVHGVGAEPGDEWFEELPWIAALSNQKGAGE